MNPRDSAQEEAAAAVERPLAPTEQPDGDDDGKALSFDCNVCGRGFPFQSSLSQHMRRHTGARPYKCPYCDHRASQKGNLKVHIRSHKLGVLIQPDPDDSEEADESEELASGESNVSEGLEGGNSPTKSGSACNGVVHGTGDERGPPKAASRGVKRERSVDASRTLRCRLCGHEVQREDQLLSHIEKAHIRADADDDAVLAGAQQDVPAEPEAAAEDFACDTCGQAFAQAHLLKAHVKKHAAELEHRCKICGRGFREAWFLKSHMKTHSGAKASGRGRPRSVDLAEPPATVNDVVQDPEVMAAAGAACLYEVCAKCGNLFHDRESLRAHSRAHSKQARQQTSPRHNRAADEEDSPAAKRRLLEYLCLRTVEDQPKEEEENSGKRVPELDPVCSYQAWQLANRGRLAEPAEYNGKWDNSLAGATVTYDRESSRYVLAGQERKPSRRASYGGVAIGGSQSSPSERSAPDESPSDSEYRPSSRQERRRSTQSRSHECFECGKVFRSRHQLSVHERSHRREGRGSGGDADSRSPSRPGTPQNDSLAEAPAAKQGSRAVTEEKPYVCSLCDFITPESSVFISHLRLMHPEPGQAQEPAAPKSTTTTTSTSTTQPSTSSSSTRGSGGGTSSYPKLKRALLHGTPSHSPSPSRSPSERPLAPNAVVATHARALTPQPAACEPAVDLCVRPEGARGATTSSSSSASASGRAATVTPPEGLPSHRCTYCAHHTRYPEVLWLHQMIAHRLNSSALVPKWAQRSQKSGGGGKKGSESRRRTGPPPALEGKECPSLPANVRSSRTRPPASSNASATTTTTTASSSSNSLKRDRPSSSSSSSSVSSSSAQPRPGTSASASAAGKTVRPPTVAVSRQRGEPEQPEPPSSRSRPRVDLYPRVGSAGALEKSAGGVSSGGGGGGGSSSSATSPKPGARMADRYLLPQEGLGFMLTSKHGFSEYGRPKNASPSPQTTKAARPKPKPAADNQPAHAAITSAASVANHLYGASQPQGGAALLGLGSPHSVPRSGVPKQETLAAGPPDPQLDILSFLKNCNSHELATLYHRWGMANPLLEHTGLLRSLARQGEYVCQECGKSFSQPSHLRTHMRSHTVVFEFNGLGGTDARATSTEAPQQGRDRSGATSARTEPLRKGI